MKINLKKKTINKIIESGDILIVKKCEVQSLESELEYYFYIYDTYGAEDEAYLINLKSNCVYPAGDYLIPSEYKTNNELVESWFSQLEFELTNIIPNENILLTMEE